MPRRAISFRAVSITVSVLRPRKSNFTSPASSTHFMLNWVAGKLRARIAIERHQLDQRPVGDDHAGGMGRGVAVEAFELAGRFRAACATIGSLSRASCSRGSPAIACGSVTGLAGFIGTSLHSRSTWP